MGKKYEITHLGKTLHTDHWYDLPEDKCLQLKAAYYEKPDFELVKKNLKAVYRIRRLPAGLLSYNGSFHYKKILHFSRLAGGVSKKGQCFPNGRSISAIRSLNFKPLRGSDL